jgi:hypothetical protein
METINLKDLLESNGFVQIGEENGTPVYSIKKEEKCSRCGKTEKGCDCEETYV